MNPLELDMRPSVRPPNPAVIDDISQHEMQEANTESLAHALDKLREENHNEWLRTRKEIMELSAEEIAHIYGEEMLVWSAGNAMGEKQQDIVKTLSEQYGYDDDLLCKAYLWSQQNLTSTQYADIIRHYSVMERIKSGILESIDVPEIVKHYGKEKIEITDKRAADYGIIPLWANKSWSYPEGWTKDFGMVTGPEPDVKYSIWLDGPSGFALTYKGRLNAVVGLATTRDDELMIVQTQGVKAHKVNPEKKGTDEWKAGRMSARGLMPLDWHGLMIGITEKIAEKLEINTVGIQSAENNQWIKVAKEDCERDVHLKTEAAERAYDIPAKRLDYTIGEDGNWRKSL